MYERPNIQKIAQLRFRFEDLQVTENILIDYTDFEFNLKRTFIKRKVL